MKDKIVLFLLNYGDNLVKWAVEMLPAKDTKIRNILIKKIVRKNVHIGTSQIESKK